MILYIETYKLEPNTNQSRNQTEPNAAKRNQSRNQTETKAAKRTQSRKIDIKFIQVL